MKKISSVIGIITIGVAAYFAYRLKKKEANVSIHNVIEIKRTGLYDERNEFDV
jgi:uncharacterized membrane protein